MIGAPRLKTLITQFFLKRPALCEPLRYLLTRLGNYEQGNKPDIRLLSCRRSGSTSLMEIVAGQSGCKFVRNLSNPGSSKRLGCRPDVSHASRQITGKFLTFHRATKGTSSRYS